MNGKTHRISRCTGRATALTTSRWLGVAFLGAAALVGGGCAITGQTAMFTVPIDRARTGEPRRSVRLAPVELEKEGSVLYPVGVFAWGDFNAADLATFDASLRATLSAAQRVLPARPQPEWELFAVLRSYMVSASNDTVATLACVAWCLADGDGTPVFHDQFFAAKTTRLIGTLGGNKNTVNEAIVTRIAEMALKVASLKDAEEFVGVPYRRTFDTFAEAEKEVPKELVSQHHGGGTLLPLFVRINMSVRGVPPWKIVDREVDVDWKELVKVRRAARQKQPS